MTAQSHRSSRLAISDAHGHLDELRRVLRQSDLIDGSHHWTAGSTRMWILGDYLDRGVQGLEVIDLVRQLQAEASATGGCVSALLGNHELQFLAARKFGDSTTTADPDVGWLTNWRRYGGVDRELAVVTDDQVEWMTTLPLICVDDGDALMHSDTAGYLELGSSVDEINGAGRQILESGSTADWADLHHVMTRRGEFLLEEPRTKILSTLEVDRIVHGHNTLRGGFGLDAERARRPWRYGGGQVLAIDGGVFEGGDILLADL